MLYSAWAMPASTVDSHCALGAGLMVLAMWCGASANANSTTRAQTRAIGRIRGSNMGEERYRVWQRGRANSRLEWLVMLFTRGTLDPARPHAENRCVCDCCAVWSI